MAEWKKESSELASRLEWTDSELQAHAWQKLKAAEEVADRLGRELDLRNIEIASLKEAKSMMALALKDIRDNYDCDSDAHRYGTRCRKCAAGDTLAGVGL